jgi:hypothetical protein
MPCHAMHPMQDYFWEDLFYTHGKFDMQPICTSMLAKKLLLQKVGVTVGTLLARINH